MFISGSTKAKKIDYGFCSEECLIQHKAPCLYCNTKLVRQIERNESINMFLKRSYCNTACYGKHKQEQNTHDLDYSQTCKNCNQPFKRAKRDSWIAYKQREFCSIKCKSIHQHKNRPIKIPQKYCEICSKPIPKRNGNNWNKYDKQRTCSHKCSREIIKQQTIERYGKIESLDSLSESNQARVLFGPDWRYDRIKANKRDNNTCQLCAKTSNHRRLETHHIYNKRLFYKALNFPFYQFSNHLDNLATLCTKCHNQVEIDNLKLPDIIQEKATKNWYNFQKFIKCYKLSR